MNLVLVLIVCWRKRNVTGTVRRVLLIYSLTPQENNAPILVVKYQCFRITAAVLGYKCRRSSLHTPVNTSSLNTPLNTTSVNTSSEQRIQYCIWQTKSLVLDTAENANVLWDYVV